MLCAVRNTMTMATAWTKVSIVDTISAILLVFIKFNIKLGSQLLTSDVEILQPTNLTLFSEAPKKLKNKKKRSDLH